MAERTRRRTGGNLEAQAHDHKHACPRARRRRPPEGDSSPIPSAQCKLDWPFQTGDYWQVFDAQRSLLANEIERSRKFLEQVGRELSAPSPAIQQWLDANRPLGASQAWTTDARLEELVLDWARRLTERLGFVKRDIEHFTALIGREIQGPDESVLQLIRAAG